MHNSYINWSLISELHSIQKAEIDFVERILIQQSLINAGWTQNRSVLSHKYKKMWAISTSYEPGNDIQRDIRIKWGYDIINKHFNV